MCGEEYTKTNFSLYSFKADSHSTSRFRSVAERHRSVKFSYGYLNGYVHTDSNVSVKSQFRSVAVAERECLTGRNGSEPVRTSSILIMWTVNVLSSTLPVFGLQRVLPAFSSEIDEKLIVLVRKCEEIYDMSNEKYSDSVRREKLWEQIGEELKKSGKFQLRILKYYQTAHIGVTIINK